MKNAFLSYSTLIFFHFSCFCKKLFNVLGVNAETGVRRGKNGRRNASLWFRLISFGFFWFLILQYEGPGISPLFFFFLNYQPLLSVLQKVFREVDCLLTNVLYKNGNAHKIISNFTGFMALINSDCGFMALKCQLFHA